MEIEEEKVEVVTDFLFLGSKVTVDDDCSHEIRRWLLLGRKAMTNLDSVLKKLTFLCWQEPSDIDYSKIFFDPPPRVMKTKQK